MPDLLWPLLLGILGVIFGSFIATVALRWPQGRSALQGRSACLLAHHGMIVCGKDLRQALALAVEFETLCEQYWRVLQIGKPKLLDDAEMARVLEKFAGYGQQ